jgi:hypothetical protein
MWEPRHLTALWATAACCSESFTFTFLFNELRDTVENIVVKNKVGQDCQLGWKESKNDRKRRNLSTLESVLVLRSCGVLPPAHKLCISMWVNFYRLIRWDKVAEEPRSV